MMIAPMAVMKSIVPVPRITLHAAMANVSWPVGNVMAGMIVPMAVMKVMRHVPMYIVIQMPLNAPIGSVYANRHFAMESTIAKITKTKPMKCVRHCPNADTINSNVKMKIAYRKYSVVMVNTIALMVRMR